jgi:diacylglycerol O-acyltransferase / wax synthase
MARKERRRMRGSEAMFMYFENTRMPLHIGAVMILDGPFDKGCEELIESRLPEIPRYRQRAMFSPFNLTHPAWEYDPDFKFSNHIRRMRLDPPGSAAQLSQLTGKIFTELMDRSRPLWDITAIEGLEGGRTAIVVRVHHSIVDGVSGIGLMKILFDPTPAPRKVAPQPYLPPPLPEPAAVLAQGIASYWPETVERLIGLQLNLMSFSQVLLENPPMASLQKLAAMCPELFRTTDRLPFNKPCSGERGYCWASFPFQEFRAIRAAANGTINDVALTAVAGAVSRYVKAHNQPVAGKFARLLMPVNLRAEDPRGETGVEISMLPISLPLDIDDPIARFRAINARSMAMKNAHVAELVAMIGTWLGFIPPALQTSLAALPFFPQPTLIVNMVCTNVPGPMVPLYLNGRKMLASYPHVPCGAETGIAVAIHSYNQEMHFGLTYDMQAAPDGDLFRDFLVESYQELRQAAGVKPMAVIPVTAPAAAKPAAAGDTGAPQTAPPPPLDVAAAPKDLRAHRLRAEVPKVDSPGVPPAAQEAPAEAPPALSAATAADPAQKAPVAPPPLPEPLPAPPIAVAAHAAPAAEPPNRGSHDERAEALPPSAPAAVAPPPAPSPKPRRRAASPKRPSRTAAAAAASGVAAAPKTPPATGAAASTAKRSHRSRDKGARPGNS